MRMMMVMMFTGLRVTVEMKMFGGFDVHEKL